MRVSEAGRERSAASSARVNDRSERAVERMVEVVIGTGQFVLYEWKSRVTAERQRGDNSTAEHAIQLNPLQLV